MGGAAVAFLSGGQDSGQRPHCARSRSWYHTSHIAEMLNAILWGIYDYLWPEFRRAFTPENFPQGDPRFGMYRYDMPPEIGEGLPRAMYWDLMNEMRRKPSVEKFTAHWSLKGRY
jgi:hypothetical protein